MGPISAAAIVGAISGLSMDIFSGTIIYNVMDKLKHPNRDYKPDPLNKITNPQGEYDHLFK